jgi:hypothetical protein
VKLEQSWRDTQAKTLSGAALFSSPSMTPWRVDAIGRRRDGHRVAVVQLS